MNNNSSTKNNIKRDNINIESHTISLEELISLKQLIFNLTEENLVFSTQQTMKFFDLTFPYSFNYIISNLVYFAFYSQHKEISIYVNYLQLIQNEEEIYKNIPKIIEFFCKYISEIKSQEAYYLIDKMIEYNLIHKDIIKSIKSKYFSHYRGKKENKKRKKFHDKFYKYYNDNYIKLSKNDWELHKQYIKEGFNPNEIAKIIRNDEIEKLQEISSQTNFDFNQIIEPSLYARCDFINQFNVTLIDYAAFFGSVKCFKYLLMNNANLKNTCKYAIAGGNLEIIHLCEQNHSKFENTYETAIIFHRNDVFKYIYENKLEEKSDNDLIVYCINGGNYEILSFLEEKGMIINDNIINETAKIGNLYLLKHFLKNTKISKNISIFGMESGNVEMIKFLLEQNGIDINAKSKGRTALMYASFNNHIEMVKLLLEQKGIDINVKNEYGNTALIYASSGGHTEIVQLLLEQEGIDINAKDKYKRTALTLASENGHIEIVKLLLEQEGIDINAKDNGGWTTLMDASFNGHIEIVKLLLEQEGIDINAKNEYKRTALTLASFNGHIEIVKLLLEQEGIDINAKDNGGRTALIVASWKGHTETVKLLLEKEGIDINAKDDDGETALMKASFNGHTEIVKLLNEKGA